MCGKTIAGEDVWRGRRGSWLAPRMVTGGQSGYQCPLCEAALKKARGLDDLSTFLPAALLGAGDMTAAQTESVAGEARERTAKRPPLPRHLQAAARKATVSAVIASFDAIPADEGALAGRARQLCWAQVQTLLADYLADHQAGVLRRLDIPVSRQLEERLALGEHVLRPADFSELLGLLELGPDRDGADVDGEDARAASYRAAVAKRLNTRKRGPRQTMSASDLSEHEYAVLWAYDQAQATETRYDSQVEDVLRHIGGMRFEDCKEHLVVLRRLRLTGDRGVTELGRRVLNTGGGA